MRIKDDIKIIEKGDKIKCQNICAQVAKINYQDYDRYTDTFIIEFYDTKGNIRNWHQNTDGGTIIPKPKDIETWIGFEKTDSRGDNNIRNYDIMEHFFKEGDAQDWVDQNPEYRLYMYGRTIPEYTED